MKQLFWELQKQTYIYNFIYIYISDQISMYENVLKTGRTSTNSIQSASLNPIKSAEPRGVSWPDKNPARISWFPLFPSHSNPPGSVDVNGSSYICLIKSYNHFRLKITIPRTGISSCEVRFLGAFWSFAWPSHVVHASKTEVNRAGLSPLRA